MPKKCSGHCPFCNCDRLAAPGEGQIPADFEWVMQASSTEDSESTMARLFAEHNYR